MKKTKLSGYFVFISVFTFLAIFIVIVQRSYSNLMGPIKSVESNALLRPINPELDTGILEAIENRQEYIETGSMNIIPYTDNQSETGNVIPDLVVPPTPVATPSASN
jgi:hypothetical protein